MPPFPTQLFTIKSFLPSPTISQPRLIWRRPSPQNSRTVTSEPPSGSSAQMTARPKPPGMHCRSCRRSTLQLLASWTICQILIRIRLCRLRSVPGSAIFPSRFLRWARWQASPTSQDMMLCRESGTDFLAALTGFTNVVLAGLCPKEVSRCNMTVLAQKPEVVTVSQHHRIFN